MEEYKIYPIYTPYIPIYHIFMGPHTNMFSGAHYLLEE